MLENFLDMALKSAGADKGCLVLEKAGRLFVEVSGEAGLETVVKPVPLENSDKISAAVARYVARTREMVVLNDGEEAGIFSGDKYIMQYRPQSIVCLPVLFQGLPAGVLYLENSLLAGVFTI